MYLNVGAVDELVQVLQPDHVMVDVAPDLDHPVKPMGRHAVRADAGAAVQAADVLLVLLRVRMGRTRHEELLRIQGH